MNLLNNHNLRNLTYLALMATFLAILFNFDGNVSVQVTPLSLKVQVTNSGARCPTDRHIQDIHPQQPQQRLATYTVAQLPDKQ